VLITATSLSSSIESSIGGNVRRAVRFVTPKHKKQKKGSPLAANPL
jgi:hypothetical protein